MTVALIAGRAVLIAHALEHLDEAIRYTLTLPATQPGIRGFLLGSIFPGVATLDVAATGTDWPKIDRQTMISLLAFIDANAANDAAIARFYQQQRDSCAEMLNPS